MSPTAKLNQLSGLHLRPLADAQQELDNYLVQHTLQLSDCLSLAESWGRSPLSYWFLTQRSAVATAQNAVRLSQTFIKLAYLDDALNLIEPFNDGYITLQRALINYWRGNMDQALVCAQESYSAAKAQKDVLLAIASLTLEGEALLAMNHAKQAVISFGKALGLTEYSGDERLTILPLAGLGHAQHNWGYPEKATRTLQKALSRAQIHEHQQGLCRVYQALALATEDKATYIAACHCAQAIPHLPLWIQSHLLADRQGVKLKSMPEAHKVRGEAGILV